MGRIVGICTLLVALAANAAPSRSAPWQEPTASDTERTPKPLAVIGFGADPQLDARDLWLPTAVEETLAWRLRRVPALTVVPTLRAHQARRELAEDDHPPADWSRVVRLLGAKLWLKGTCAGTSDALMLDLELTDMDRPDAEPQRARFGPGRLFAVLDEATRWMLDRLGISRVDTQMERLILSPPSPSPSALEYYARALSAAREENFRDGAYYAEQALDADRSFRPALLLLAKVELRGSSARRARAAAHLRQIKQLAAEYGDQLDESEFALAQGLLELMLRSSDAAQQRFESALADAFERDDLYGQIAAMNSLCDLWLNREPPPQVELPPAALQRFRAHNLRRAAEWQTLVLDMLQQLGDVVSEASAANKLALIYEQLEQPQLALQAHQRTIAAAQKTGSARTEATGWLFLGQWYRRQERWAEALEATSRCLELVAERAKPPVRIAMAEIYRGMSLPRDALAQYELAYEALVAGGDLINQFRCLRATAELRMELDQREAAIEKLTAALDIAQALELPDVQAVRQQLDQWKSDRP